MCIRKDPFCLPFCIPFSAKQCISDAHLRVRENPAGQPGLIPLLYSLSLTFGILILLTTCLFAFKTSQWSYPFCCFLFWTAALWLFKKNFVDFLMHQNQISQLLLTHNVIHPNDLNILLLMDVVLNNVALSK